MPKISVIIPVYNTERYLRDCMDSIVNQTLKDIEIICINDGSSDSSLKILKEYEKRDSRIIVIDKENTGAGDSRNKGLEVASGEYVGFVDSDDWIDCDYYEKLYSKAFESNANIVRTAYTYHYLDGSQVKEELGKIIEKRALDGDELDKNEHSVVIWNAIYKTDFIKNNNIVFDNVKHGNDIMFTARATLLADKIFPCIGYGYHYRFGHEGQITTLASLTSHKMKIQATNALCLAEFLFSLDIDKNVYLVAFDRCIVRMHKLFLRGLQCEWFNKEIQKEFFEGFCKVYSLCKYPEQYAKNYDKPYLTFLKNGDFTKYRRFYIFKLFIKRAFRFKKQ